MKSLQALELGLTAEAGDQVMSWYLESYRKESDRQHLLAEEAKQPVLARMDKLQKQIEELRAKLTADANEEIWGI